MKITRAFVSLLLLVLPAAVCAQEWRQALTPGAVLLTDQRESEAQQTAAHLEQVRALYSQLLHRDSPHLAVPLRIILARPASFAAEPLLAQMTAGMPAAGFHRDEDILVADSSAPNGMNALAALYANRLMESNYPRTQPWFDLGVAELIGSAHFTAKDMQLGGPHPDLPMQTHWIPVAQLFSAAPRAPEHARVTMRELCACAQGMDANDFAAESWTVMRWVLANQRLNDVGNYFGLIMTQGATVEQAIARAFGMSPAELDAEFQQFARQMPKAMTLSLQSGTLPQSIPLEKVPAAEARAMLAEAAASLMDDPAPAVARLHQMMQDEPRNARLHHALAVLAMRGTQPDVMMEHVRRALELNPDDALMHFYYAVNLNRGDRDAIRVESASARLRGELSNAIRSNPSLAEAHALYGLALASGDHFTEALNELGTARRLAPRDDRIALSLARVMAASGNLEGARRLLGLLQFSPEPVLARTAREELAQAGYEQKQRRRWERLAADSQSGIDPRWQARNGLGVLPDPDEKLRKGGAPPDTRKVEFFKGRIVSITCAADGSALLRMNGGGALRTFKVTNYPNVLLIGPDRFDCSWRDVAANVNYKAGGGTDGDVVSIEVHGAPERR